MWVTTFHSSCARMLRADAERLGYSRGFTIYDESDSLRMLKRCMNELGIDPKRYPPRAIRAQISGAKNKLVDAAAYAEAQGSVFEETVAEVYALYEKRMLAANAMDFDDLLVRTVNALELFEEVRERWRRVFKHVLVDEYQDTNHAQYRLLQLLSSEHGNLMVVGDEDQSIYGFRHADIRNILDFERDFPEAEVVKLEQNYRSTQTILSAANAVVERNRERREKRLWTEIAGGEPVQLAEVGDEHEEARWVAGEIQRLGEEEGVRREDVAVFYRTNAMSRVLEDTLVRFERPLPGDRRHQVLRAGRDQGRGRLPEPARQPLRPGLLRPRRQLAAARDRQHDARAGSPPTRTRPACRSGRSSAGSRRCRGWARRRSRRSPASTRWSRALVERAERGAPVAEILRGDAQRERLPGSARGRAHDRGRRAGSRTSRSWSAVAAEFDANHELEGEGEVPPLEEFLQQISLYTEQDGLRDDESLITLMTLHNAKGLEYDTVFIVGCEEGSFPHMRALEEGGEEEERRLCYVGITRARQRLYMTWARERRLFGRAERNLPSRFVDELPAELTERHGGSTGRRRRLGRGGRRPAPRSRSTPARPSSCAPATTSSTPASATASSPASSRAGWSSSASPATAPSAS